MSADLKDFRGKITAETDVWLDARARITGKDKAELVREILHEHASREIDQARVLVALIQERGIAIEFDALPARPAKRQDERLIQAGIAADLDRCGVNREIQVDTGAGVADIVVYEIAGAPWGVIEVKASCRSWREVHHAAGQARAYADALNARVCIVAAGEIPDKFLGERGGVTICRPVDVAALFTLEGVHVLSMSERR